MYASLTDLVDRFGADELTQLTTRWDPDAAEPDESRANNALEDATAEMDVYIGTQYALPLASVPVVLKGICCDVARYRLFGEKASDEVRRRFDDAVTLLNRIAKGTASLGLTATPEPAAAGVAFVTPGRVMSKDLKY